MRKMIKATDLWYQSDVNRINIGRTFHIPAPKRAKPSLVRWVLNLIGV